jgi:ABC-type antimicrobial peptide transport system permease subunit
VVLHIGGNQNVEELAKRLVALREQGKIPPFRSINTEAAGKDSLGSDMFVYMALENIKVFMIGGIFVTLAGLVAAAIVNFIEGKRIFALLRLRGASPKDLIRVILTGLVAPLFVGAGIGVPVGLVTGYGLTNAIFALPRAASVLEILPVHLTLSWFMAGIILFVLTLFFFASLVLSAWIFRRTAREALGD